MGTELSAQGWRGIPDDRQAALANPTPLKNESCLPWICSAGQRCLVCVGLDQLRECVLLLVGSQFYFGCHLHVGLRMLTLFLWVLIIENFVEF